MRLTEAVVLVTGHVRQLVSMQKFHAPLLSLPLTTVMFGLYYHLEPKKEHMCSMQKSQQICKASVQTWWSIQTSRRRT